MTTKEHHKVRSYLAGLEALVLQRSAGGPDEDALLEFRRQCWAALLLLDDAECQQQIDVLVQHAKDFFGSMEDDADTRQRLQAAINACRTRLDAVENGYGKRWRDLRAA